MYRRQQFTNNIQSRSIIYNLVPTTLTICLKSASSTPHFYNLTKLTLMVVWYIIYVVMGITLGLVLTQSLLCGFSFIL